MSGDAAFDAAARVLPNKLRAALASESLEEIRIALQTVERTYRIFPERESDQVKQLRRELETSDREITEATEDALRDTLKQHGSSKKRKDRMIWLQDIAGDRSDCNLQYMAKEAYKDLLIEVMQDLEAALAVHKGLEVLDQYSAVIDRTDDEAVLFVAEEKHRSIKITLDKLALSDRNKKNEGQVGVASALVGLSRQLQGVLERGDVLEQEEMLERVALVQELAAVRGIEMPEQVDTKLFEQAVQQIQVKQAELQANAQDELQGEVTRVSQENQLPFAEMEDLVDRLTAEIQVLGIVQVESSNKIQEKALLLCADRLQKAQQELQTELAERQLHADTEEYNQRMEAQDQSIDPKERMHNIFSDDAVSDGVKKLARDDYEIEWAKHWMAECDAFLKNKIKPSMKKDLENLKASIEEFYTKHTKTPTGVHSRVNRLKKVLMDINVGVIQEEFNNFEQKRRRIDMAKTIKLGLAAVEEAGKPSDDLAKVVVQCLSDRWQDGEVPQQLRDLLKQAAAASGQDLPQYLSSLDPSALFDQWFDIGDVDHSGEWELDEFLSVKRQWFLKMDQPFDEPESREHFALLDLDNDGRVTREEFKAAWIADLDMFDEEEVVDFLTRKIEMLQKAIK